MKRFLDLTFRPFFVLTGIVTALGALNAFWPRWAIEKLELIPFIQDYTIILQHWGIPILIYSAFEKAFLVYLVATNVTRPYARGFWFGAGMDATVVLYTVVYFGVCGFKTPSL